MKRRRATIPVRRRIFLGCEGESEQAYGALLARLADNSGLHLAFRAELLRPGGGDPLALVSLAADLCHRAELKRGSFAIKAILLDSDKLGLTPERDRELYPIANVNGFRLIWQNPTHEAFLLRHLPGCHALRPPTPAISSTQLRQQWAEYEKPMSALRLSTRIGIEELRAAGDAEESLRGFLEDCGFIPRPEAGSRGAL